MKGIAILFFFLLASVALRAHEMVVLPGDPAFETKYENFNFKGHFAVLIDSDADKNYYLLDFSKLHGWFERVYFMSLSFSYDEIVNLDPDIENDKNCFMSFKIHDEKDILKIFSELKERAVAKGASWTEAEKENWLNENDKYKIHRVR